MQPSSFHRVLLTLFVAFLAPMAASAQSAESEFSAGQSAMAAGDAADAELRFRTAIKLAPRSTEAERAYVNLGILAVSRGDYDEAITSYDAALALKADDTKAMNGKATALIGLKKVDEAIALWEKAATTNPRDPLPLVNLGHLAMRTGEIATAEQFFGMGLVADPASADGHNGLAQIALIKGDYRLATTEAKAALRSEPDHVAALAVLGKAHIGMDQFASAAEALRKAADLAPGEADVQFHLGVALYNMGDYGDAGLAFADTLDLAPNDPQVHLYGGLCFHQLDMKKEADEEFDHALELGVVGRDKSMALFHKGLLRDNAGKLKEAETFYREAVKADPKYAIAANNLGLLLQRTDRLSDAVMEFRRAVSANPDYFVARLNLGHALWMQGLKSQAKKELELLRELPVGHELREKAEAILADRS